MSAQTAGDLLTVGQLFADLVFTGVDKVPQPGTEVWAEQLEVGPGGIANIAVAARRLGLSTSLAAPFGDDIFGRLCWDHLEDERIDLSHSRWFPSWPTPITVSVAHGVDRSLVSHASAPPVSTDALIGDPPPCRAAAVDIGEEPQAWLSTAAGDGTLIFADVGWDSSGRWSGADLTDLAHCHAFLPSQDEAMRYMGADTPERALGALAELVPVVVVTRGRDGAIAVDATTGERQSVSGISIDVHDTTGAGDAFTAGFIFGTLRGWALGERLRFANLVGALSTTRSGGWGAPIWEGIAEWWRNHGDGEYGFVARLIEAGGEQREERNANGSHA